MDRTRSSRARQAAAALALLLAPLGARAERRPVLPQIRAPHSYYYREMYLPQVTSGPGGPAWSPDGSTLVFSMQGSLWKTLLGSGLVEQITSGPGYDSQPDWSPDGRFIVFASYGGESVELQALDVATGEVRPLTTNGAVNVEPRFSPDGQRLVFVSTLGTGRFHLFLATFAEGGLRGVAPLTEEHDSGLPRYYYSPFDHEISPCWSPDGREILFVSNRGHVWGTGGFWRMAAEPGSPAREVRYEETNWRARPDWSRDGRRVVYASYLGQQWHQLWLMTGEGGDPFPLTYGAFDRTAPRFSPDSRRIAFLSNEDGDTSLWTLELPGGRRERVSTARRRPLRPMGRLVVEVLDAATGAGVPARISVTGADGRGYAPDNAWRHADDAFDRGERRLEYAYFHTASRSTLDLPAGDATVEVSRGPEYERVVERARVVAGETGTLTVSLRRIHDLPSSGWWSGDLHVHMNYGGVYRNDPRRLALQAAAEDLHVVESLIVNKEQRIPDVGEFQRGLPDPASTPATLLVQGQEYHTSYWGHLGLLGLTDHLLIPGYAAYAGTPAASLAPMNATILRLARAQGALGGYVHPFDEDPDPGKAGLPLTHELPVDAALGLVDYYEVLGFSDHLASARVWYRLLNCGFRIPAGAGTDAMANYASLRGPVGLNRVFVRVEGALDHAGWLQGIRSGRTFVTNGPLLEFSLGGKGPGDEIRLPRGEHALDFKAALHSQTGVDRLEILGNGVVVERLPLSPNGAEAAAQGKVRVRSSGWYTLRAYAEGSRPGVLDIYPFATTSPIYVDVGDAPVRSAADASFFVAWIDRLVAAAGAHDGWNTPAERQDVLNTLGEARRAFVDRAGRGPAQSSDRVRSTRGGR